MQEIVVAFDEHGFDRQASFEVSRGLVTPNMGEMVIATAMRSRLSVAIVSNSAEKRS